MRRTFQLTAILVLASVLGATNASAQDCTQDIEAMAAQGAEHFRNGDYMDAASVLLEAHTCQPVPVLLYNIARAYQQADRCVLASYYFLEYLDTGDTQAIDQADEHEPGESACAELYNRMMDDAERAINEGDLEEAERKISEARSTSDEPEARLMYAEVLFHRSRCQESVDFLNSLDTSDMTPQERGQVGTELARAEQCVSAGECEDARQVCEEERRQREDLENADADSQRTLGLIITGVGGAVLLGAVVHDAASQGTIDDYETAAAAGDASEFQDLRDSIDSGKTLSWILYGVGAAGVAAGLVVYFTAGSDYVDPADCSGVCWDWGVGTPGADVGAWLGGSF